MRFMIYPFLGFIVGAGLGAFGGYCGSELLSWLTLIDRICHEGSCKFGSEMNGFVGMMGGAGLGFFIDLWRAWRHGKSPPFASKVR